MRYAGCYRLYGETMPRARHSFRRFPAELASHHLLSQLSEDYKYITRIQVTRQGSSRKPKKKRRLYSLPFVASRWRIMPLRRIKPRGGDRKRKRKRKKGKKERREKERQEPQSGLVVAFKRSSVSKKGHKESGSAGEGNWKMTRRA